MIKKLKIIFLGVKKEEMNTIEHQLDNIKKLAEYMRGEYPDTCEAIEKVIVEYERLKKENEELKQEIEDHPYGW